MKLINLLLVAAATIATVQGYTFEGNVAGPCSLSALYPTGNNNCPAPDSQRAKCQSLLQMQSDGAQLAGAGTMQEPTIVPVKLTYVNNAGCDIVMQQLNVSVWDQQGTTMARLSVTQSQDGSADTITGTSTSSAIIATYQANANAPVCQYTYTLNSGSCFLSDRPASTAALLLQAHLLPLQPLPCLCSEPLRQPCSLELCI